MKVSKALKVGSKVFNVFWIIFVGIWAAIESAVMGALCCCTIVGIPIGLQYFKFIQLAFAPAGKKVVLRYGKHPIMNTLWLIFGGLVSYIFYALLAGLCVITIIGIPISRQLMKIATFMIAPFGCEVVVDGEWTSTKDTGYDMELLKRRILANPDKEINETNADGTPVTARQYVQAHASDIVQSANKVKKWRLVIAPIIALVPIMVLFIGLSISDGFQDSAVKEIFPIIVMICFTISLMGGAFLREYGSQELDAKECVKIFSPLMDYYPNGSDEDKCKNAIGESMYPWLMNFVEKFNLTAVNDFQAAQAILGAQAAQSAQATEVEPKKFCEKCGAELSADSAFCKNCGAKQQ